MWRAAALALCAIIAATVFAAPDPDANLRSAIAVHDFGHVIAFAVATALLAFAVSARSRSGFQASVRTSCLAVCAALALGTAVELAQEATGGNGDPWDVVRDGGGAFSAALMLTALGSSRSARGRAALACLAIFIVVPFAYPTVAALVDEARARAEFPVLASFANTRQLSRFEFRGGTAPNVVRTLDADGRSMSAIQLHLPPGRYTGFVLRYFPNDWSGMRTLQLQIINADPTPIDITVRIDDARYDYKLDLADRYNRSFLLSSGANRIDIPLSDVEAAPRGRRLDLGHVQRVLVYVVDLAEPRDLVIGPIVLLP